jgi:hypothetical protein
MSLNIERVIEDAAVTRIKLRTYISTNSIPVRRYNERTASDASKVAVVVVRCRPAELVNPSATYYSATLELMSKSYLQNDIIASNLDLVYQECLNEIQYDMTVASLNTTITDATISIDGIIPIIGDDEGDDWGVKKAQATIYLTYTA